MQHGWRAKPLYPRKMERHFPNKPDQPIGIEEWLLTLFIPFPNSPIRTKNRFIKNGTANFGIFLPKWVDHLQRWSRIFLSEETKTDLSVWIPTEISGIFGIMESTPYFFMCILYSSNFVILFYFIFLKDLILQMNYYLRCRNYIHDNF